MLIKYSVVCCIICSSSLWFTFLFHFQNVLTNFEVKTLGMFVLSLIHVVKLKKKEAREV